MFTDWAYTIFGPRFAGRWLAEESKTEKIAANVSNCVDFALWIEQTIIKREAGYPVMESLETLWIDSPRFSVKKCLFELRQRTFVTPEGSRRIPIHLDPARNSIRYDTAHPEWYDGELWASALMWRRSYKDHVYVGDSVP